METPTVKISVPPCPGNEEGIVIINESDFDPKIHTKYEPGNKPKSSDEDKKPSEEKKAHKKKSES